MFSLFVQNNLFFLYFMFLFAVKAINEYASRKSKAAESNAETTNVDPRLEEIVERMLNKVCESQFVLFDFICSS